MAYRWMPIMGKFDLGPDEIGFRGGSIPATDASQAPIVKAGILVSDQMMVNGRLTATVSFETVSSSSVCELIVGYDTKTQSHVSAGIGGSGALFSIREWVTKPSPNSPQSLPSGGWRNLVLGGDRGNLLPTVPFELAAWAEGSTILLDVNGVRVAEATLASAVNQPRQVGVFCLSETDITIRGFAAAVERPKAFIVMQFSAPYNDVYSHVIKDACEEFKIEAVRADEIYGPGIIIKDVIDRITKSQVIIADISPVNPNVYFEVGYALALGKPIILLAQKRPPDSPLPFDLSAFRVLFYDDSIGGKPKLEEGLRNHLREILGRQ